MCAAMNCCSRSTPRRWCRRRRVAPRREDRTRERRSDGAIERGACRWACVSLLRSHARSLRRVLFRSVFQLGRNPDGVPTPGYPFTQRSPLRGQHWAGGHNAFGVKVIADSHPLERFADDCGGRRGWELFDSAAERTAFSTTKTRAKPPAEPINSQLRPPCRPSGSGASNGRHGGQSQISPIQR